MSIFINGANGGSGHSHKNSLTKILGGSHSRSSSAEHPNNTGAPSNQGNQVNQANQRNQLAEQYERDREALTRSCFAKTDNEGKFVETYITHVRIIEDSHYPSSRPPPSSPASSKKFRVIIIAVRASGKVRVHKARENPNGTFQIGKTWNLDELTEIVNDPQDAFGFVIGLGKPYYWTTNSVHEKGKFIENIIKIYKTYTHGGIPKLQGLESIIDASILTGDANVKRQPDTRMPRPSQGSSSIAPAAPVVPGAVPVALGAVASQPSPPPNSSAKVSSLSGPPPHQYSVEQSKSRSHQMEPPNVRPNVAPLSIPETAKGSGKYPTPNISHEDIRKGPQARPPPGQQLFPRADDVPRGAAAQAPASARPSISSERHSSSPSVTEARKGSVPSIEALRGPPVKAMPRKGSQGSMSSNSSMALAAATTAAATTAAATTAAATTAAATTAAATTATATSSQVRLPPPARANPEPMESPSSIVDTPVRYLSDELQPDTLTSPSTGANINIDYSSDRESPTTAPLRGPGLSLPEEQRMRARNASAVSEVKFSARAPSPGLDEENEQESADTIADMQQSSTELKRTHHRNKSSVSSTGSAGRRRISFSAASNASAVEETLTEFNWTGRDDSAALEKRITDEINQIEMSHLHNIVDLDDRLDELDKTLESAIIETDELDNTFAFFSVQLGSFLDDISHIEGQGQGLQIQTTNQKALWTELDYLLRTVSLADNQLEILQHNDFENIGELQQIEGALADLYDALKAVRVRNDRESEQLGNMRALKERRAFVEQAGFEFMLRFCKFCEKRFKQAIAEAEQLLPGPQPNAEPDVASIDALVLQKTFPITGILLFAKEMDVTAYQTILKEYEVRVRPYYAASLSAFFSKSLMYISAAVNKPEKLSFVSHRKSNHASQVADSGLSKSLKKSGTLAKLDFRDKYAAAEDDESEFTWVLSASSRDTIIRIVSNMIETTTRVMVSQQEVLISLFHLSSFGENNYTAYITNHPVNSRIRDASMFQVYNIREIDSDRKKAQSVLDAMSVILSTMQEHLLKAADAIINTSELMVPAAMWLVEVTLSKYQATNEEFLSQVYQRTLERLFSAWGNILKRHVQEIGNTIISSKKRRGVLTFVRAFPKFCLFIEDCLVVLRERTNQRNTGILTSKAVEDGYEKISKAIFYNLQRIAKVPTNTSSNVNMSTANEYEDKELLNYHVMMIENMNYLRDELDFGESPKVQSILQHTRETYRKELSSYIRIVLHRPAGRVMDFVEGVNSILARSPNEDITRKPGLSRSSFKKVLATIEAREMRKNIEVLRRRVEKHFSGIEEDTASASTNTSGSSATASGGNVNLINKVWSAIQAEFIEHYNSLCAIGDKYYSDAGDPVQIPVTKAEIVGAFQRKF